VWLAGCNSQPTFDLGAVTDGGNHDALVFQPCTSVCYRPADCAVAYPDQGLCPSGFACSRTFSCD
jgi:hypothetical protein